MKVFRSLVMPSPPRPAGLIQRYREELQARHDARRTVKTYEAARDGQCGGECLSHPSGGGGPGECVDSEPGTVGAAVSYRKLLQHDLDLEGLIRARTRPRLPVVMTLEEVRAVLERLEGVEALVAGLLYGGGLRL